MNQKKKEKFSELAKYLMTLNEAKKEMVRRMEICWESAETLENGSIGATEMSGRAKGLKTALDILEGVSK